MQFKRKPRTHGKFFRFVLKTVRFFKRKHIIINENDSFENQAIFISNHSGISGPMNLLLYFPAYFVPWGAHPMVGKYRERYRYMYYVFYQKKLKYSKFKSFILASFLSIFSKMVYKGMRLIPTYEDIRLHHTFRLSMQHLDFGEPILIFPEDSNDGYLDVLDRYNPGFVALSEFYYKRRQIDLPIYPIYFHKKGKAIKIGKPYYIQELLAEGKSREEILIFFRDLANEMGQQLQKMADKNRI